MKVSSTGYPPLLYKNESLTIDCKAADYTTIFSLYYVASASGTEEYYGCAYYNGQHLPSNGLLLQPAFPDLTFTEDICQSSIHPTTPPSTLSVTGTVTGDLTGLQLHCSAGDGSMVVRDGNLTVDIIGGELL